MSEKPYFLSEREWEVMQAFVEAEGDEKVAAFNLEVTRSAVQSTLSRIRQKVVSAANFKRKYWRKYLERKR